MKVASNHETAYVTTTRHDCEFPGELLEELVVRNRYAADLADSNRDRE